MKIIINDKINTSSFQEPFWPLLHTKKIFIQYRKSGRRPIVLAWPLSNLLVVLRSASNLTGFSNTLQSHECVLTAWNWHIGNNCQFLPPGGSMGTWYGFYIFYLVKFYKIPYGSAISESKKCKLLGSFEFRKIFDVVSLNLIRVIYYFIKLDTYF